MPADLLTATGRIRYAVGDTDDTNVLMPPFGTDGIAVYTTLYAQHGEIGGWRAARAALKAYYATLPTSVGDSGSSVTWAARIDAWSDDVSYPFAAAAESADPPAIPIVVAFATVAGRRGR